MFTETVNEPFNNKMFTLGTIARMDETAVRLYQAAKELKKTEGQSAVARLLNESPQTMTNWEKRGVSKAGAIKAQAVIGCSATWLLSGQGPMRAMLAQPYGRDFNVHEVREEVGHYRVAPAGLPVVGTAKLGDDGLFYELQHPVGHGDGRIDWPSRDPNAYALRCKGDSMKPRIKHGEFVVVEPNHAVAPGDEVLVKARDGRVMVKELAYIRDGMVYLDSVNEAHPKISIPQEEVEVLHYVAGIAKQALWRGDDEQAPDADLADQQAIYDRVKTKPPRRAPALKKRAS